MTANEMQNNRLSASVVIGNVRHIGYRPDIDGLRAIAVLAVLVFHAFPAWLPGGFAGVDVFFVISGFLISKVILAALERGTFTVGEFYSRRIRRIFPALLTVLLCCLAFGWNTMLAEEFAQLAKHVLGGATFVSNLMLWSEAGYFDRASELKPLLHLWSLGIEEQFYIVWPLLLWAGWRLRISILAIAIVVVLASLALNLADVHEHTTATFYSPLSRAWELGLGAVLVLGIQHFRGVPKNPLSGTVLCVLTAPVVRATLSIIGLLLIGYSFLRFESTLPFPGAWALLPTLGAALIIAAGSRSWVNRVVLGHRAMVAVGLISFPLYLWHWPVLIFARQAYPQGLSWEVRLAGLLVSVILATLTYLYIERPLRASTNNRVSVFVLCSVMGVLIALAGTIYKSNGYPSRYPPIIQRATEYDLEGYRAALRNGICFIEFGHDAREYAPECVDNGEKPLWVLWGDSGAAALYSGLRGLAERSAAFRIAQFTSSSCPPMLGYKGKGEGCESNNEWTIEKVRELVPDTVILAGIWEDYEITQLAATIAQIKQAGARRVIVLGPAPAWKDTPSRIAFNLWRNDPFHRVPSERLDYAKYGMGQGAIGEKGMDTRTEVIEQNLKYIAEQAGASYISIVQKMCNEEGCLMRESAMSGDAFYLDIVHLTPHGSAFVIKAIASEMGVNDR
ncbi:acyltransferase family protein [Pseudomonas retamae]|uniref:Acyltransferase family protein n=1 Tax=Pseudomonas retamae TaxID=702110 RepID=A0ABW7DHN9_9PSED